MEHEKTRLSIVFFMLSGVLFGLDGSVSPILFDIHYPDQEFKDVPAGLPRRPSRPLAILHRHRNQQRKGQLRQQDDAMPWIQGV